MANRTALLTISLLIASVVLSSLPSTAAFSRVASMTLNSGENNLLYALIDPAGGYAYFGTQTIPGRIIRVHLPDFTRAGNLTLNTNENWLVAGAIDPAGGFAYFGSNQWVEKVRLSNFTRVGALHTSSDSYSAVIDPAGGYAYFGSSSAPGIIVRVRLSDFTLAGVLTLNSGENSLYSAVVDPIGGYAYFGTFTTPGIVVKVRLSDFSRIGNLTLKTGEGNLGSAVIDPAGGYAYFGAGTAPGVVIKIRLSDFTRVGALTLNSGENYAYSGVIDTTGGYAYFGTDTTPGIIVKIRLSDFTRVGAINLNSGENYPNHAIIDPTRGYAYFASQISPGIIVKVQVATAPTTPSGLIATGGSARVTLSWSPPTDNGGHPILGYKVYRATTSGGETGVGSVVATLGNVTTDTDTGLAPGTTFYYKVSALNDIGETPLSTEATATPTGATSTIPPSSTALLVLMMGMAVIVNLRIRKLPKI